MGRRPTKNTEKKKKYFGELEEQTVLSYLSCTDDEERKYMYVSILKPAFDKMIESIIRRYKLFIPDEDFIDTFNDTSSFLLTKMDKYNPQKRKRAFSYYQTIVRNYLLGRLQTLDKNTKRYPTYEDAPVDISNSIKYTNDESRNKEIAKESVNGLVEKIEEMLIEPDEYNLRENEVKLGKALINLFENWDYVLSTDGSNKLNKNAILFFLREHTGMDTKGIRDNMKKYKKIFFNIKKEMIELS